MKSFYTVFQLAAFCLFIMLCGCASQTPVKKSSNKSTGPAKPVEPARNPPAAAPSRPAEVVAPQPVRPAAPKADATTVAPKPAGDAAKHEFGESLVGGRKISEWILLLDSKNKAEVLEAINACAVARPRQAIEKLTALSKSSDKEIADEAAFALQKTGSGR